MRGTERAIVALRHPRNLVSVPAGSGVSALVGGGAVSLFAGMLVGNAAELL